MTNEEVSKLKRGDEVLVRAKFWGLADGRSYGGLLVEVGPEKQLVALDKRVCELRERRKFKTGDLVRWKNIDYLVLDDEYDSGQVLLQYSVDGGTFATANEVQLLMTAYEVSELRPKGGSDD